MEEWRGSGHAVSQREKKIKTALRHQIVLMSFLLALREGKAMELFRKLREKPKG